MSSANSAAAVPFASLSWQRPLFLFSPPFSPPQPPLSSRKFLCLSLSRLVSSRSRFLTEAAPTTTSPAETDKKRVLIINTNSGGHAVIGFYFARELLAAGHEVTILTVGEVGSDKMKKPPFTRFSVEFNSLKILFGNGFARQSLINANPRELVSAGARTVWGGSEDVGRVVGSDNAFDVVLDNNGKDLDSVK